jgi:phosphoglycolate phosphatase-like HAD superfamily hydrolase
MMAKAVFFDIDGTLVDSNEFHVAAWDQAFREAGLFIPRDAIHAQIGKGADMLLPTLLPELSAEERDHIAEHHGAIFRSRYLSMVKAFPGATDLIKHLHEAGCKVLLASSSSQSEVDHYIELFSAREFISGTATADDVSNSKPAPDIFACALAKVAPLRSNDCIAVGDTPYDVIAAAKCQIDTVAVRSGGFSETALKRAGAVAIYLSVRELLEEMSTAPLASPRRLLGIESPAQTAR